MLEVRFLLGSQHGAFALIVRKPETTHPTPHLNAPHLHETMAGITFGNLRGKGCECSKCEGVVLCAARNLLPDSIKPTHYTVRRES